MQKKGITRVTSANPAITASILYDGVKPNSHKHNIFIYNNLSAIKLRFNN
jgi:hypothetical protein